MPVPSKLIIDVAENTSGKYTAQLVDEDGVAISNENLEQLTLTLYDAETESIINSRVDQNVLNANNVTIDCAGNLEWKWVPADQPIVHSTRKPELHTALWKAVWNNGEGQIRHEIQFRVYKVNHPLD